MSVNSSAQMISDAVARLLETEWSASKWSLSGSSEFDGTQQHALLSSMTELQDKLAAHGFLSVDTEDKDDFMTMCCALATEYGRAAAPGSGIGVMLSHAFLGHPTSDRSIGVAPPGASVVIDLNGAQEALYARGDRVVVGPADDVQNVAASIDPLLIAGRFETAPEHVIADGAQAQRFWDASRLLTAADVLGAMQAALSQTVKYVNEREQFGRVVGSFQAVKHQCAEMATLIAPLESLVLAAARATGRGLVSDADDDWNAASLLMNQAWVYAHDAAIDVARGTIETHGGVGFTAEYGLHLWFKRLHARRILFPVADALDRCAALSLQS